MPRRRRAGPWSRVRLCGCGRACARAPTTPLTGRRLWRLARALGPEIGHQNAKRKRKTQTPFAFLPSMAGAPIPTAAFLATGSHFDAFVTSLDRSPKAISSAFCTQRCAGISNMCWCWYVQPVACARL